MPVFFELFVVMTKMYKAAKVGTDSVRLQEYKMQRFVFFFFFPVSYLRRKPRA